MGWIPEYSSNCSDTPWKQDVIYECLLYVKITSSVPRLKYRMEFTEVLGSDWLFWYCVFFDTVKFNTKNVAFRSSCPVVSLKKVLLKILQNSQENTCSRVSLLIKPEAACNFVKKGGSGTGVFLWVLWILRTCFFIEHLRWLLLCFITLWEFT